MSDALTSLLLALADDELVLGHRHSEWTGFAPHLEEDVAFSSIAQDEIGHAAALYGLIAKHTGDDPDVLALGRRPEDYRHAVICARPNGDWAYTLARHWLYDHADEVRLVALEASSDTELAALATKMRREERYHLLHADAWLKRIAHGPVEGRTRMIEALGAAYVDAVGLFEPTEHEGEAVAAGFLPMPSDELRHRFERFAAAALDDLGLPTEIRAPLDRSAEFVASSSGDLIAATGSGNGSREARGDGAGGRSGRHSEDFTQLWSDMTATQRAIPGARW